MWTFLTSQKKVSKLDKSQELCLQGRSFFGSVGVFSFGLFSWRQNLIRNFHQLGSVSSEDDGPEDGGEEEEEGERQEDGRQRDLSGGQIVVAWNEEPSKLAHFLSFDKI